MERSNETSNQNAPEVQATLNVQGELQAVLAYRVTPKHSGADRPGLLHLSDEDLHRLFGSLTTTRGSGCAWVYEPDAVARDLLLPHLSELFAESGAPPDPTGVPPSVSTWRLRLENVPGWEKAKRDLILEGKQRTDPPYRFRITRDPRLYVFGTGIVYVSISLALMDGDGTSFDRPVAADTFLKAIRRLSKSYDSAHGRAVAVDGAGSWRRVFEALNVEPRAEGFASLWEFVL